MARISASITVEGNIEQLINFLNKITPNDEDGFEDYCSKVIFEGKEFTKVKGGPVKVSAHGPH